MPQHRKIVFTDSLIGQIIKFSFISKDETLTVIFRVISHYTSYEDTYTLLGDFIAGDVFSNPSLVSLGEFSVLRQKDITQYQILTVRDLPLYIGMKHTTPLLAQLIKGE